MNEEENKLDERAIIKAIEVCQSVKDNIEMHLRDIEVAKKDIENSTKKAHDELSNLTDEEYEEVKKRMGTNFYDYLLSVQ